MCFIYDKLNIISVSNIILSLIRVILNVFIKIILILIVFAKKSVEFIIIILNYNNIRELAFI